MVREFLGLGEGIVVGGEEEVEEGFEEGRSVVLSDFVVNTKARESVWVSDAQNSCG